MIKTIKNYNIQSANILDFINLTELHSILYIHLDNVLTNKQIYIYSEYKKFVLLHKVRNSYAHHNKKFIPDSDILLAKHYCQYLIKKFETIDIH